MSDHTRVLWRLLAAVVGAALLACTAAAGAQASYGEILNFGEKGTGSGQLNPGKFGETASLGVNPEDNSVFVVDQPNLGNEDEFRLQKFENIGGQYKVVASTTFEPRDTEGEEEPDVIQGLAVDPKLGRVYVLAVEERRNTKIALDDDAAAQLYAFETKQSGNKLLPAPGTSKSEKEVGVLAGTKVLRPLSNNPGLSLLEPSGITVDEAQEGDVLIVGREEKVEHEELVAVQQIKTNGEMGTRWVDKSNVLEEEATSPAVAPNGKIYVEGFGLIAEIPGSLNSATQPTIVPSANFSEMLQETLVEFPGEPPVEAGGALAIGPEGTVYTKAGIQRQFQDNKFKFPGVLEFNSSFEEEGWTGGQNVAAVGAAGPCKMSLEPAIQLQAGKEHTVFVYDSGTGTTRQFGPKVIEFGPGGSGCPVTEAPPPTATVEGQPVSEGEKIPISDEVTFSSELTQGNAMSVTWHFGDGTETTVPGREFQHIEVTHKFVTPTTHTVTAVIHTDDLASPQIEVSTKESSQGPEAITGKATQEAEDSMTLNGVVNTGGIPVSECFFEYGTSTAYGKTAACTPEASKLAGREAPVSAEIGSLTKGTTYDFRLVIKFSGGENAGVNATAKTKTDVPEVTTQEASLVGETSAKLEATVNPNGSPLSACEFEYGPAEAPTSKHVPCSGTLPTGSAPVSVSATVTGLSPNTKYGFQIAATGEHGHATGSPRTFTTKAASSPPPGGPPPPPPPPPTTTGPSTGVESEQKTHPAVEPIATLAGSSAQVSGTGTFTLKVTCPQGETGCLGTLTVKTLKAVIASAGGESKSKAAILTLASGSFSVAGGQAKTITLHLSSKGRALLGKSHTVSARVTIVAHDAAGHSHTTVATVTLRAAKGKHH